MFDQIKEKARFFREKLFQLRDFFNLTEKSVRMEELQELMNAPDFWNNQESANKILLELKYLKSVVEPFEALLQKVDDFDELADICQEDTGSLEEVYRDLCALEPELIDLETRSFLGGKFDKNNVILSINAGAGGTESCDWASMLLRMYTRFADLKGFKVRMVDMLHGEEAGIKNATLNIEGEMAYGLLKSEKGVHRLVRISPFDANKRRHTSFASIDVIPEVDDEIEIEINPDELRIDIFRSSGPGGQSVNTTDSAVRITHLPTGIVVQCQNERSQLQNRTMAMKILKARLYEKKRQEQEEAMAKEYGQKQKIEWGSQIRSYVMHPYSMVKDHRTDVETGNVQKVMDGDITMFIEAFLRWKPE
ncbi:MAG TPA: peptide chain release factor 2 [Candidatus Omnitrophota bacterium]|nr:peptide chain release factor 2 [Candidatus Omnitrophota bacterium]HSA30420.1 peptide chain release factor 2 [Candidatus Omnitrophota bacterium]